MEHGLRAIATEEGTFAVVALDQRNTIRRMFAKVGQAEVSDAEMIDFKADIMTALQPAASAFLVDPDYGMPAAKRLPDQPRTLLAAEPAVRGVYRGEPEVVLDPTQDAKWVRSQGADALKFYLQLRADRPVRAGDRDLSAEALEAMARCIEDCEREGVPSVIENLIYPLNAEGPLSPERRADAICQAAFALDALHPTLLKLEYPGSPSACRRLAAGLTRPWAVLSAGVPMAQFSEVLRISCDEGGASGFIAGRAIWADSMERPLPERLSYLRDTGRRRLDACRSVIAGRARPFTEVI